MPITRVLKLNSYWFLETVNAVKKEFAKTATTLTKGFLKADGTLQKVPKGSRKPIKTGILSFRRLSYYCIDGFQEN
jgi:hypothetical protein